MHQQPLNSLLVLGWDRVLCFGVVTKSVLITHQCFTCCWTGLHNIEVFLGFHASLLVTGDAQKAGRDTAKTDDRKCPKGSPIPSHIMLSNRNWGAKEGRGDTWSFSVGLCKQTLYLKKLCFPGNVVFFPACLHGFCFIYQTAIISSHRFSHFCPSRSLPCCTKRGKWAAEWGWAASQV